MHFRRSVIIAKSWLSEVARCYKCLRNFDVLWKTTPYSKIFKILFRMFSSRHRSTYCVQISWNLADRKSVKSCVTYLTKKISPGSPAVTNARIAPKICQRAPNNELGVLQISSKSVHFDGVITEHVNNAKTRHKVNPIFGWSLALSRIMK